MPRAAWVLSLIAALAASCDKSRPTRAATDAAPGLDAYCTNAPCRRHDDAVAKLRELTGVGSGCTLGDVGACGELRFVRYSDGYWGLIEWFDGTGAMVGAESWSDISPRTRYGNVPTCELKPVERFCGAPAGAPSASATSTDDCQKLRKNVVGEAAKLTACKTNDDCKVHGLSLCDFRELGCYAAHVNKAGDTAALDRAVSEYAKTCSPSKCKCAMPQKSVCKNGACTGE